VNPWEKWGWAFAAIWLVFLVYPVIAAVEADVPVVARGFALACIAGFAVANVLGYSRWQLTPWTALLVMVVLGLAAVPVIGWEAIAFTPYLGMLSALELPSPWWQRTTAFWALLPLLTLVGPDDFPTYFFLMVWPIMIGGVVLRVFTEQEQEALAARGHLALVAERERVARDVHDVLGHSLTALSVKAELAARLIDVDPDRARAELESIQDTARQALAEVRATVGGLRAGNLDAEVAAAPRVLADAGVATSVVGAVADTDPRHRTLLAWVLRESVTNVVRHASASQVTITLGPTGLVVVDDGVGMPDVGRDPERSGDHAGHGSHGLRGMRERVSAAGGTLSVTGGPGTRVEVVLP
jgi:two-component system sensor histidine kinase DesK